MGRWLARLMLLASALAWSSAQAEFFSGNKLYEQCGVPGRPIVIGYVAATKAPWCLSSTVTLGQLSDIVCNYLRDNPDRRDGEATFLVFLAMPDRFFCGHKNQ